MSTGFVKANRHQLKGMVALTGPSGAGKTWTALQWAGILGPRVAFIDTENRSSEFYADRFDFDVMHWAPPYSAEALTKAIRNVAQSGEYDVLVLDSLTHFWEGEGGVIDTADAAGRRKGNNSWAGWSEATPLLRHLIDTIRGCGLHVICCLRSDMETVQEKDDRGKTVVRKVGMSPRMRKGIEYEFTVVGELDIEHNLSISKTRCDLLDKAIARPGRAGDLAETFRTWLGQGATPEDVAPPAPAVPGKTPGEELFDQLKLLARTPHAAYLKALAAERGKVLRAAAFDNDNHWFDEVAWVINNPLPEPEAADAPAPEAPETIDGLINAAGYAPGEEPY